MSASDVGAVPTTRKINNMDLTADRTLTAENISYDDGLSVHAPGSTGKAIADLKGSLNTLNNSLFYKAGDTLTLENSYMVNFAGNVGTAGGVSRLRFGIVLEKILPHWSNWKTTNIVFGGDTPNLVVTSGTTTVNITQSDIASIVTTSSAAGLGIQMDLTSTQLSSVQGAVNVRLPDTFTITIPS